MRVEVVSDAPRNIALVGRRKKQKTAVCPWRKSRKFVRQWINPEMVETQREPLPAARRWRWARPRTAAKAVVTVAARRLLPDRGKETTTVAAAVSHDNRNDAIPEATVTAAAARPPPWAISFAFAASPSRRPSWRGCRRGRCPETAVAAALRSGRRGRRGRRKDAAVTDAAVGCRPVCCRES